MSAGEPTWTVDDSIAVPVFEHPLMTAMQQVTYHPGLQRYLMAVWSWHAPFAHHTYRSPSQVCLKLDYNKKKDRVCGEN